MMQKKPNQAEALKQLKSHLALLGVWVAIVRVTPYILDSFSKAK